MVAKSEQEEFLVEKMVARVKVLKRENELYERQLDKSDLSDENYDLYQGLMDKNIGEQNAYRRMEDHLREWREIQRAKEMGNGALPNAVCGFAVRDEICVKSPDHMGGHVDAAGETM